MKLTRAALAALLALAVASPAFAVDTAVTGLTAATQADDTDLVYCVKDPSGTPLSRKCTAAQLRGPKNTSAASDPTANDDSADGYSVGSVWTNTSTRRRFVATTVTVAAAAWAPAGYSSHPGYRSARWYSPYVGPVSTGQGQLGSTVSCTPWTLSERVTITDLAAEVATISASGNFQLGIWATDPTTGKPTGLPLNYTAATLSTGTAAVVPGALQANGGTLTLEGGVEYQWCHTVDNGTAVFRNIVASSPAVMPPLPFFSGVATTAEITGGAYTRRWSYNHTFSNNMSSLNINPASVTAQTANRDALIYFKVQ